MTELTVTEALQEVKTINARLIKKQDSIGNYVARDSRIRDPLEKNGGSAKFITEERQSIADLRTRLILIRSSIQSTNLNSQLTISGVTRSVADWLTWRREISTGESQFITALLTGIRKIRNESQKLGGTVSSMGRTATGAINTPFTQQDPPNIIVNADEAELMKEQERLGTCLSELDGKLSLFNATTIIKL